MTQMFTRIFALANENLCQATVPVEMSSLMRVPSLTMCERQTSLARPAWLFSCAASARSASIASLIACSPHPEAQSLYLICRGPIPSTQPTCPDPLITSAGTYQNHKATNDLQPGNCRLLGCGLLGYSLQTCQKAGKSMALLRIAGAVHACMNHWTQAFSRTPAQRDGGEAWHI